MPDPTPKREPDWSAFREQMEVARRWAYFDHAAVSPLPRMTREVIEAWARDTAENGDVHWTDWARRNDEARRRAARLLGAGDDETALIRNTTEGISLVAEGFPWREGDNVVTLANEFPSNQYPWLNLGRRGVETRRVPVGDEGRVDVAVVADACDARTRIVAVSWVGYASGFRLDVDELVDMAHGRGALVFLDAIQALGVFPLDVGRTPVDFLAADGHKWMLGPEGAGVFYLRREHLELLAPLGVGWNSVVHPTDYGRIELELRPSAVRYEGGSPNMPGFLGFGASLELLSAYGPHAIGRRLREVAEQLCERVQQAGGIVHSPREAEHQSGIISFEMPGQNPLALRKRCLERNVAINCRGGRLRASPHAYNTAEDIDRLVAALSEG